MRAASALLALAAVAAWACLCSGGIPAAEERPQIRLQAGTLDVLSQPRRPPAAKRWPHGRRRRLGQAAPLDDRWGPLAGAQQLLIAHSTAGQSEVLQQLSATLRAHGGWLGGYLPDSAVLGIGSDAAAEACRQLPGVLWVGPLAPEHKLAPQLRAALADGALPTAAADVTASFPLLHYADAAEEAAGGLGAAYDPASAAAAEWPAALAAAGVPAQVRRRDSHTVTCSVPAERAQAAVAWLSAHPAVHWLAPAAPARLHNWQGTAVTQSATAAPAAPVPLDQDQGTHPLWAAGLTGAGQVIGGGDSGMDYNNCFFADPTVNWTQGLQTDAATGTLSFNSTAHRKIRLYRSLTNGIEPGGHGTHTMGSLLGSVLNASDLLHSDYRGMAPDAKLAFNDLGSADGISTPEDLASSYFSYAYAVGARVHSDSWGSAATAYDYMAAQVDLFTWQHQDFTSVFAAGNEGAVSANNSAGATTVTSPATAKNCVTVGATEVAGQTPVSNPQFVTAQMTVRQAGGAGNDTSILTSLVMQAAFGGSLASLYGQQLALSVAQPLDGCGRLQNGADVNGTVTLVQRGTCYVSTKVANAQTAGARAVVVYDNQISEYFLMLADGGAAPGIGIPGMAAPRLVGQLLAGQLQAGGRLKASFAEAAPPQQAWANLAPFSSKGPTPDGRIKPDVLAPGTLMSAHTDAATGDTCSLQRMQGTSMATPLVAGSAALVRQYFLSGAYPSGAPDAAAAFAPSGPLVKAVLIGGAAALGGFEPDTGLPLAPPPSFRQGFGRVLLSRSLPLQGAGKGWSMQLVDRANLTTGGSHRYCLNATGGPLSVTLVWHDYPALLSAAKALVNDLDLTVRAAGLNGVPLLGNGGEQGSDGPDRTNNVEQVAVAYMPPGQLSIEVAAHQVFAAQGPQPYSLVVLGSFTGSLASAANPAGPGVSASDCSLLVPQITGGPQGVTSNQSVSFTFGLRAGATGTPVFECAVAAADASAAPDFAPCTSPAAFSGLADGGHTFQVRVRGEQLGDSRAFVTDTTPPTLSFSGPLPQDSASAAANFTFAADDASPVNTSCRFTVQGGAPQQGPLSLYQPSSFPRAGNASAGQWLPCTSPLAALGLLPGQWSFEVAAVDAAGNKAASPLSADWSVAFQPGLRYARWEEAPLGLTDSAQPALSLQVLAATGAGLADADAAELECQLVGGDAAASAVANISSAGSVAAANGWQECGESPSFGSLADGTWAVLARPAAGAAVEQLAATAFTVDTTPPSVQISEAPNAVSNSSSVQLSFQSDDPTAQFSCSLASAGAAAGFQPCTAPAQFANLSDGAYSFRVAALDAAGNEAPPAAAAFRVDTRPPAFADIRYPVAVRAGAVRVSFVAQDAPNGSGINSTECRLQAIKLAGDAGNFTGGGWQNCSSPFTFSRLPQGHFALSLKATDNAALVSTTSDMDVWVSSTPPTPLLLGGPGQAAPVPNSVAFNFTFAAANGLGTPVTAARCRLVQLTSETAAAAAAAPPSNASLPGASQSPVQGGKGQAMNARFWQTATVPPGQLQNASLPLAPSAAGNLSVPAAAPAASPGAGADLGSLAPAVAAAQAFAGSTDSGWRACSSPVAYQGLRSGNFSFQVAGADAAGNQGPPLPSYLFAVDASLAPDGSRTAAFWGLGWKFWLIIAGSGALLVFAATGAALAVCFGRRRRRRQGGSAAYVQEQLEGAHAGPADSHGFSAEATAEALRRSLAGLKQQQQQQQAGCSEGESWQHGLAHSRHESQLLAALEDAQLREALQRSASQASGSGTATPLTARSTAAEQQRALLSSREDRDLHRALMLSLHESQLASARSEPAAGSSSRHL